MELTGSTEDPSKQCGIYPWVLHSLEGLGGIRSSLYICVCVHMGCIAWVALHGLEMILLCFDACRNGGDHTEAC